MKQYKIQPKGFFKEFLDRQMSGLTGHIEKAGYPYNKVEWGKSDVNSLEQVDETWWPYEQTAYWTDGYTRCSGLLGDEEMFARVKKIIYNVLNNADSDGYLGPKFLKDGSRWPHVVFFRSCMAYFDFTEDENIIHSLTKHYLGYIRSYANGRDVFNIEIMLWLYGINHNQELLDLAEKSYKEYNDAFMYEDVSFDAYKMIKTVDRVKDRYKLKELYDRKIMSNNKTYVHGVSYNEYSKLGAILYMYTGKKDYLKVSISAYKKIDKYYMLIDGCNCSDEFLVSNNIYHNHETCDISDFTWSQYYMYKATKSTEYLDKIDRCVFNAGLGAISNDFKALQYFSNPNQVYITDNSDHSEPTKSGMGMQYYADTQGKAQCCVGNVNRFMPNYILNMWDSVEDNVYLKLFGASKYSINGIEIEEETNYPFDKSIKLTIKTNKEFNLNIRLPKWADRISIDGEVTDCSKGGFYIRKVQTDCVISLILLTSMKINQKDNFYYITDGVLLYSFEPASNIQKVGDNDFPNYLITPKGAWNYGINKDAHPVLDSKGNIIIEAYIIKNWKLLRLKTVKRFGPNWDTCKLHGKFIFNPRIPKRAQVEQGCVKIKLIPYGKTMARITAFPKVVI